MALQSDAAVYMKLSSLLKKMILSGELKGQMPSERELAVTHGINIKTVNKAVLRLVGEGLVHRVRGKGAFVCEDARTAGAKESKRIGLAVYDFQWLNNPFYAEALAGIGSKIQAGGHRLQFMTTNKECSGADGSLYYMSVFDRGEVDGMIVAGEEVLKSDINRLHASGMPLVLFVNRISHARVDCVCIDNVKGGRDAAAHLLSLGHERIAFIQGFDSKLDQERIAGCRMAMEAEGLELPDALIKTGNFEEEGGRIAMLELLRLKRPPTAVIASDDLMAAGAMQAMKDEGRSVPSDVSVVGFGDMAFASKMSPSLTTLKIPICEMGRTAMEMLDLRFCGSATAAQRKVFEASLIVRQSTAMNEHRIGESHSGKIKKEKQGSLK